MYDVLRRLTLSASDLSTNTIPAAASALTDKPPYRLPEVGDKRTELTEETAGK